MSKQIPSAKPTTISVHKMARGTAKFLSRTDALAVMTKNTNSNTLMVDTLNGTVANMRPFVTLNPFHVWDEPIIPVPGKSGVYARSIESIWQGLKLIDNVSDNAQFFSSPYKRPSDQVRREDRDYQYETSTFEYLQSSLPLLVARMLIYLPSYLYLLNSLVKHECIEMINSHLEVGDTVVFYDWDANGDMFDDSDSFAHSSILASWFNGSLEHDFIAPCVDRLEGNHKRYFMASLDTLLDRYKSLHGLTQ